MKFTVEFDTMRTDGPAVDIPSRITTISDIDFIREKLNVNVPLEKIIDADKKFKSNPIIELDEDNARKIDVFRRYKNHIIVIVPGHFLDEYIYKDVYVDNIETDEIKAAAIEYKLDEKRLINDWIRDGAPMKWGFPVEEKEEINIF